MYIVGHAYKPGFGILRQEEYKFKISLVFIVRICLKNNIIQLKTKQNKNLLQSLQTYH